MSTDKQVVATPTSGCFSPTRAVPILLFMFVFSLVIDNGFKFRSLPISKDLNLPITQLSLQATLAGLLIGIGAVVRGSAKSPCGREEDDRAATVAAVMS